MLKDFLLILLLSSFVCFTARAQDWNNRVLETEHFRLETPYGKHYAGLSNLITIRAIDSLAGTLEIIGLFSSKNKSDNDVHLSSINRIDEYTYELQFNALGEHNLILSLNKILDTVIIIAYPLPFVVQLGRYELTKGIILGSGEFKAQSGLLARVTGFDIDAYLTIESFTVVRVRNGRASKPIQNRGANFSGTVLELIRSAFPRDFFLFSKVKVKGPGFKSPVTDSGGRIDIE